MEFQVNVWATVKILTTSSYNLIRNCQTVLETLGPWCLPDKKLVVSREKLESEEAVLQSFDDDGRRSIFEDLYLPRTYQYFRRTK
jgi:hypothetical protein